MPAAQYPMHVLPVARLLQLRRLPTHEEIKHELVEQRDGKKGVRPSLISEIFWGGKLKIPAKALSKIQYVWLDVCSIPQADRERQGEAIASIPNYVERAAFFVCVAGAWRHESGALRDVRALSLIHI